MSSHTLSINRQNQTYFALRWIILIGFSVMLVILQDRNVTDLSNIQDILTAAGVGAVLTVILGAFMLVVPLRPYKLLVALPGDWIIAALFAYVSGGSAVFVGVLGGALILNTTLRFRTSIGAVNAVAIITAGIIGLVMPAGMPENILTLAPVIIIAGTVAMGAGAWSYVLDETNLSEIRKIRQKTRENSLRLANMQERIHALADMTTQLNSSLKYDDVIDSALDIGRLSLKPKDGQRTISMVLMVDVDYSLTIASSRGLNHRDANQRLAGKEGVIAQTFEEGTPIITDLKAKDPELSRIVAFQGIKSVLVIPLRASMDTYGVLVFGSSERRAFNEDTIDTLQAIGTQTAIALQNAALYSTLMEEKERIIQIEEDARKALVRDLHDIPTQTISGVAMRLGLIPVILKKAPEQLEEEVETIREMALRATEEIRHVLFTLRPLSLESQGLKTALEQLVEKMAKTYKQQVVLRLNENALASLLPKQEGTLFYLIEEAVNNARKYANASQIAVRIDLAGPEAVVRVIDNGDGFDMSSVTENYERRGSFGMVNMRERAEIIGATFEMSSQPGKGTIVTVRIPVTPRRATASANGSADSSRKSLGRPGRQGIQQAARS